MKKRIINLFIALVLVSANTFATGVTTIIKLDAKSLIVDTKNWKSEMISIEIRDFGGSIIFQEDYNTEKGKRINFENLPNGRYAIILSDDLKSTTQYLDVYSDKVTMQPEVITTYKPLINVKENFIDLNYLATDNKTMISVYDDEYESVFKFNIKDKKNISQRFDISNLPAGDYTFSVSNKTGSFSKRFTK